MISTLGCKLATTVKVRDIESGTLFRPFDKPSDVVYLRTQVGAICIHRGKDDSNQHLLGKYYSDQALKDSGNFWDCRICPTYEVVSLSNG